MAGCLPLAEEKRCARLVVVEVEPDLTARLRAAAAQDAPVGDEQHRTQLPFQSNEYNPRTVALASAPGLVLDAPMNILLITADQWRGDCLGTLAHPCVRTPVLDRLARTSCSSGAISGRPRRAARPGRRCTPGSTPATTARSPTARHSTRATARCPPCSGRRAMTACCMATPTPAPTRGSHLPTVRGYGPLRAWRPVSGSGSACRIMSSPGSSTWRSGAMGASRARRCITGCSGRPLDFGRKTARPRSWPTGSSTGWRERLRAHGWRISLSCGRTRR